MQQSLKRSICCIDKVLKNAAQFVYVNYVALASINGNHIIKDAIIIINLWLLGLYKLSVG